MSGDQMNQEGMDVSLLTDEQRLNALATVDRYSTDMADKVLLCQMLGIIPSGTRGGRCRRCDHVMSGTDFIGHVRPGNDGYCSVCYRAQLREREAAS